MANDLPSSVRIIMHHLPLLPQSKISTLTSYFCRTIKHLSATFMKFKWGAKSTEAQHSMQEELVIAEEVTG